MSDPTPPNTPTPPNDATPPADPTSAPAPDPAPGAGLTPPPFGTPPGPAAAPPYASGYGAPSYPPSAYPPGAGASSRPPAGYPATPPPGYAGAPTYPPGAAYGAPYGYGGYTPGPRTNALAVTSMICSIVGVVLSWTWVLALAVVAGVITGHIALGQIKKTGEKGRGMALAGVIIGWVAIGFGVLIVLAVIIWASTTASLTSFGS